MKYEISVHVMYLRPGGLVVYYHQCCTYVTIVTIIVNMLLPTQPFITYNIVNIMSIVFYQLKVAALIITAGSRHVVQHFNNI